MLKLKNSSPPGSGSTVAVSVPAGPEQTDDYRYWPLEILANHVASICMRMRETDLPFLKQQFTIVCLKHRRVHPEITGVAHLFDDFAEKLEVEIANDTETVLVYVRSVERCHSTGECSGLSQFGSGRRFAAGSGKRCEQRTDELRTIRDMAGAYDREGVSDLVISQLTERLDDLLHTLQVLSRLKFEIIFPRVIEMENTLNR